MDIQQRKFRLASLILLVGMMIAFVWYWHEGLKGSPYPYNTFLFLPKERFSDLSNTFAIGLQPNPYWVRMAPYPPTAYALMLILNKVPLNFFAFFLIGVLPILWLTYRVMKPVLLEFIRSVLAAWFSSQNQQLGGLRRFVVGWLRILLTLALVALCEPFLSCLDRANIELWVIFMVAASLYCYGKARFRASIAWLILPICLKIYPCVLLALFLRRNKLTLILLALTASAAITVISYSCYRGDLITSYRLNQVQLKLNAESYIIKKNGLSETASPWNLYRSVAITVQAIETGAWHRRYWDWKPLYPQFRVALRIYTYSVAAACVFIAIYSAFIEREMLRRMVALLLFMVLASPSGAEHKITHIGTALIIFILIRTYRKGDLWVAALLAFALIPKKEYIFEHFGPTDSAVPDVSSAIVLNPLAMFLALGILCWFGISTYNPKWTRQRLASLWSSVFHRSSTPCAGLRQFHPVPQFRR